MSAVSLLISAILAAQVTSGGDRYSGAPATTDSANNGALQALEEPVVGDQEVEGVSSTAASDAGEPDALPTAEPFSAGSTSGSSTRVAPPPFSNSQSPFGASRSGNQRGGLAPPPTSSQTPATSTQPLNSYPSQGATRETPAPPNSGSGLRPSAMMRAMLASPPLSRLAGRPVALAQAVSSASTREQQSERIEAYWDLCSSVADYYLGLREQEELRRLRGLLGSARPSATWQQAEAELGIRVNTSQVAAQASQLRLANLMNLAGSANGLPLPADVPHCGKYQTHYEHIFSTRPNAEAQELVALLPLRNEELKGAAMAVTRAEEWLAAQRSTANETAMLRALELLALRRRAFVQIARDYNRRIARYSELATPGEIESSRLISMLIMAPATGTRTSSAVAPPNRQSNSPRGTAAPTYADGWTPVSNDRLEEARRDQAVEQASAESQTLRKERSLLVTPR